jgi:hypothetical protein
MVYEPHIEEAQASSLENVNILCMGLSGSGKTTFGATAPAPLILATEEQGIISVKAINPTANVVKINGLNNDGTPIMSTAGQPITPWDHLLMVLAWCKRKLDMAAAGTGDLFPYRTLVLDSLQDAQLALVGKLLGRRGAGDDDVQRLGQEEYGILGQRTLDLIRFLKKLPIDLVVIVKAEEFVDGTELKIRPGGIGQMAPKELPYAFNLVLYCYKAQGEGGNSRPTYHVLTDGHSKYVTKGHAALAPVEVQNATSILERLRGSSGAGLIMPQQPDEVEQAPVPPTPKESKRPGQAKRDEAEKRKQARVRGLAAKGGAA